MTELGKAGKYLGVPHPRDIRRIDSEPPRPTVKATPRKKTGPKRYGFKYQSRWKGENSRWKTATHWSFYETEKKRDQAMRGFVAARGTFREIRNVQPIDRLADLNGERQ